MKNGSTFTNLMKTIQSSWEILIILTMLRFLTKKNISFFSITFYNKGVLLITSKSRLKRQVGKLKGSNSDQKNLEITKYINWEGLPEDGLEKVYLLNIWMNMCIWPISSMEF
jgi:capsular polysaccharide biosynthesis protein